MIKILLWTSMGILSSILSVPAWATTAPTRSDSDQLFVLIVASNFSRDEDTTPLRFADDDGAKYFELFRAAGAETELLAVLDPDAQTRFPEAARAASPPSRGALAEAVSKLFQRMRAAQSAGAKTHFVFIYSGHGNMGANREAYFNLIDAKFSRKEFFHEVLAKSPASYNHILLDACNAYYMVSKKGEKDKTGDYADAVRDFLRAEDLRQYPNTGVILAASSESETHEWSRFESGIFSHELRSALLGAADVNNDGKVTYAEAAACVEAANAGIEIPRARLKVFYHPPASNVDLPLMRLDRFEGNAAARVLFPKEMAGRYHVEDARGIRVADINYSPEQPVTLALPGAAPFFVRTETEESIIESSGTEVLASNLVFQPWTAASKGSVERSFRKHLYTVPFGMGFYRGALAMLPEPPEPPPHIALSDTASTKHPVRTWGWIALGSGIAAGIGSAAAYGLARSAYHDYQKAPTESEANVSKRAAQDRLLTSRVLLGVGSALAITGATLLIADAVKHKKTSSNSATEPLIVFTGDGIALGLEGRF
jgi:hypothetical protein